MKNYQQLKTLFARISQLQYAQRILMWDAAVMMPDGAQKARADTIEKQKSLGLTVMGALQFDFNRGRLDVSHHPFCSGGPSDVRITTRYTENEFITSLFGICHETGHALYEQGLPEAWLDQPVGHVDNMVMHESLAFEGNWQAIGCGFLS